MPSHSPTQLAASLNRLGPPEDQNIPEVRVDAPAIKGLSGSTVLEVLWRRKGVIILITALCSIGALIFTSLVTRRYTSVSQMYIQERGTHLLTSDSPSAGESYLDTQAAMLKSNTVMQDALRPEIQTLGLFSGVRDPLVYLKKEINVSAGKRDGILSVWMETENPQDGVKIVNAVVDSLVRFDSSQKQKKAAELLEVLETEKSKREKELAQQNRRIVEYKEANGPAFFQTEAGNVTLRNLALASEQLTEAKLMTQAARAMQESSNSTRVGTEVYSQAQAREENYESVVHELEERARKVTTLQAQCDVYEQEAKRTERQLDLLDSRIKEINAEEHAGALTISVFETARTEPKATFPRTGLILGIVTAFGFCIGMGAAVTLEWVDHRLRTPEEVTQLVDLPVLGVIPARGKSNRNGMDTTIQLAPVSSVTAEAYRSLRTSICFGASERGLKTILVASPTSGDGKSSTAANLAVALANSGCRTLLIDCDLRRPMQHLVFMKSCEPGLTELLRGTTEPTKPLIHQTHVEGLDLLASGAMVSNPAELLSSSAFGALLEQLALRYERIVIDSPPTLSFSDARILGSLCDGTLLVVRANKTTHRAARDATAGMLHVGARVVGVVFNGLEGTQRYGGGYYRDYEIRNELYRHAVAELVRTARKTEELDAIREARQLSASKSSRRMATGEAGEDGHETPSASGLVAGSGAAGHYGDDSVT